MASCYKDVERKTEQRPNWYRSAVAKIVTKFANQIRFWRIQYIMGGNAMTIIVRDSLAVKTIQ